MLFFSFISQSFVLSHVNTRTHKQIYKNVRKQQQQQQKISLKMIRCCQWIDTCLINLIVVITIQPMLFMHLLSHVKCLHCYCLQSHLTFIAFVYGNQIDSFTCINANDKHTTLTELNSNFIGCKADLNSSTVCINISRRSKCFNCPGWCASIGKNMRETPREIWIYEQQFIKSPERQSRTMTTTILYHVSKWIQKKTTSQHKAQP